VKKKRTQGGENKKSREPSSQKMIKKETYLWSKAAEKEGKKCGFIQLQSIFMA
jgi:hypothetical protein